MRLGAGEGIHPPEYLYYKPRERASRIFLLRPDSEESVSSVSLFHTPIFTALDYISVRFFHCLSLFFSLFFFRRSTNAEFNGFFMLSLSLSLSTADFYFIR